MKYCTDTWFILTLFNEDAKAIGILKDTRYGKTELLIPIVVYAESIKKLLQQGINQQTIEEFYTGVEQSQKVQIVGLTRQTAKEAALLSLRYGLPLMDAFVAASAKLSFCDILLAKDSDYKKMMKNKYLKVQSW